MEGIDQLRKMADCARTVCNPDPNKVRKTRRAQDVRPDTAVNKESKTR